MSKRMHILVVVLALGGGIGCGGALGFTFGTSAVVDNVVQQCVTKGSLSVVQDDTARIFRCEHILNKWVGDQ